MIKQNVAVHLDWPIMEDVGASDSVGLETGYWKGHSLGSMKF